jgi:hypothetical protein
MELQINVSGSYCVRKHDLFALTYPKVAENLSKEEAERIKNEMQTKSIAESGCPVPKKVVNFITYNG